QITSSGCYVQNSHNYHRLMLPLALLFARAAVIEGRRLPPLTQERLSAAVGWLWERMDLWSGEVPNYGHNDGSNILPFGSCSIMDYRPTLQAAGQCFRRGRLLPSGPWDELGLWLGLEKDASPMSPSIALHPGVIKPSGRSSSWAMIYGSSCKGRIAHADYLHVDLWSHGVNLLMDAGTYAYNLPPPWNNGLARTLVHNTLTVDGHDQLQRLGKFLWSAGGKVRFLERLSKPGQCWTASHDGYMRLGVVHRRSLVWLGEGQWEVMDEIFAVNRKGLTQHQFDLHWLIRDGEWDFDNAQLRMTYPQWGLEMRLRWSLSEGNEEVVPMTVRLIRQGKVVLGPVGDFECLGWYSPTYYYRLPALSLLLTWKDAAPCKIVTLITIERSGNR
ncbi:MAG: heparinase II/III-family protein, partial [Thermanaerothrix sp.]|nr:heparinase II/III-family protein [Thermanaerothrix sp.]